jgi:acyl carrier protein
MSNSANPADLETRLVGCFEAVFPSLEPNQIRGAEQSNVDSWDSIAALSLINVIEEEFDLQMDFEEAAQLTSFRAIADYLGGAVSG